MGPLNKDDQEFQDLVIQVTCHIVEVTTEIEELKVLIQRAKVKI